MVLLLVLVVMAIAGMVTVTVMFRMRARTAATAASLRGEQAYAAAMSGIAQAVAALRNPALSTSTLLDAPDLFQARQVVDDGSNRWYFTIYAGDDQTGNALRYGVIDEAGKINVNTADEAVLAGLPDMTPTLADALIDFRDSDSDARPGGAEQDVYDQLAQPYAIANGPLSTPGQLLLVRDFTGQVVVGEDVNRNSLLDANEDDGNDSFPPDNSDGIVQPGLASLVTVWSHQKNVDAAGDARIDLNSDPKSLDKAMAKLSLSEQTLDFIRLYRGDGQTFADPSDLLAMQYKLKKDSADGKIKAGTTIVSGVGADQLPIIMDRLTTSAAKDIAGLVNIDTAPVAVLAALPGLNNQIARQIVDTRQQLDATTQQTTAWLFTQHLVDADGFKRAAPYISARSKVYRIRVVGYGVPCGQYRVLEAVVDLTGGEPRTVYMRDLTRLGMPMPLTE